MRLAKTLLLCTTLLSASAVSAQADVNVVASIKPVHSLVAAVMQGVGAPKLIIEGAGSPHDFALKPSQAQMLEQANIVFWIGHELEAFLEKPIETIGSSAKSVELIDAHDLIKLSFREGGAFEKHGHDDHDEEADKKADDYDHDHDEKKTAEAEAHHDHDKNEMAKADSHEEYEKHDDHQKHDDHNDSENHDDQEKHDEHEEHAHGEFDAHIWLDPINAKAMVHEIKEALGAADPANAAIYESNAEAVSRQLDALITEVSAELEPIEGKGYVVFHDAYQYFEKRFHLAAAGSITVSPDLMPGVERIAEIKARVEELGASCVFSEPQFEPKLVSTVTEGTHAKSGVIDPLGSSLENGPELYFNLIRNMATSIKTCLSESS